MIQGYVITKKDDLLSEGMADECILSGKDNNFLIEKFYGFYDNLEEAMRVNGLFINPQAVKKIQTSGVIGCFLSHFTLWKKCLKENKPLAIFEYDALVINRVENIDLDKFDHCLNFDFTRHLFLKDIEVYKSHLINSSPIEIKQLVENKTTIDNTSYKYMNKNHIKGAFGYIIKPEGALKVIKGVQAHGIVPADVALNLRYINLHYTVPSVARLNPIMLENLKTLSHTKRK